ncbi:hypothetical protein [Drosophila suzukii associated hytrosavirus 1]|nr:hypothetical protein [Drosophila suzukii associated hytrosavirus 1]
MSKNKLSRQIDNFSKQATIISPLCSKYNATYVKPFMEAAQIYNENFRSSTEFMNLLRAHANFLHGSIGICNRLFDNYEPSKQNSIYDWSKHFFNLLNASKKLLDEAYNLAYTVGRTDPTTKTIIAKEENPLVKIRRKVIIEDGDYDTYKKTMFNWKCSIQALYVEEQYMKHLVDICNSRKSRFNPREVKENTCTLKRSITVPQYDYESTPQICVLNAELMVHKSKIDIYEKKNKLKVEDLDTYLNIYNRYQKELIAFVFTNFSRLYNETCVQCLRIFLEQQHSIIFNLLEKRKKLISHEVEKINENRRLDGLTWTDIDKTTQVQANTDCKTDLCLNQSKIVGSLH